MATTDIIIVSYQDKEDLEKCVASIEKNCTDYNLIIEDNNIPGQNIGYTKAVNAGIKKGSGQFFWLLNSDTIVLEGTQQELIKQLSYSEKTGIAGSMQRDPDNLDRIRFGGVLKLFPGGVHEPGSMSKGDCRFPKKQTWTNFASAMIKNSVFEKIGLLDERYFLIFSDSDFCLMAREKSFEVWYCPTSQVLHKLKASASSTEWHQKDMLAFMKKWGITYNQSTQTFNYSERFRNLDLFP
jgi:GT2 family glycosyltransferase